MIWILLFVFVFYGMIILGFAIKIKHAGTFDNLTRAHKNRFTVIVPFRNESKNLPRLLASLAAIDYPSHNWELILVNDASTDNSLEVINQYLRSYQISNVIIINNLRATASPKKDALQTAINKATHNWIVTTDADCYVPTQWLATLDAAIQQEQPLMVIMPVAIATTARPTFLTAYEQLDFLSLMGATAGSFYFGLPFLCNGANLAYDKDAFIKVQGFANNDHIASGDDHFLLEKFQENFKNKISYLRSQDAIVTTQPQEQWSTFIAQRTRWAAKSSAYTFWFSKLVGLLVVSVNLMSGLGLIYLAFAKAETQSLIIIALLLKIIADGILIATEAQFYKKLPYLKWYPTVMICYPFLSTYIAIKSLTSSYQWKGRDYMK
ncbi:cellulose synthase/poly-beta-1,6-N-acetylglucosamine synthase-like glycosyltransferase [Dokdonia sp. Hel_I_63]|uniref:glycosyltransferase n=1 Tax=Dokdonia sp. Hel_I_63 TaxID=1249996 RepID=UPI00119BE401|nr:glycosyltransferase [Dokdonia sp. Hel_I_63]TVZ21372.1 cellulose synthase/poly-beta-1,6-N-acetylglucosamine synthase-like glycosyltransferase [Dokdonia sp. Hel_I_63]